MKDQQIQYAALGPKYYDNSTGSLYKFAEDHKLNAYEFEVIKRILRCRKKGEWLTDIDKTINVLNIYKVEQKHKHKGETEPLNKQLLKKNERSKT